MCVCVFQRVTYTGDNILLRSHKFPNERPNAMCWIPPLGFPKIIQDQGFTKSI